MPLWLTFDLSRTLKHGVLQPDRATLVAKGPHTRLNAARDLEAGKWKTESGTLDPPASPPLTPTPQPSLTVGNPKGMKARHSPRNLLINGRWKQIEPLLALASRPALLFNAPLLLALSAGKKWGQKVPLRAQHNKTKAAQRSICQPLPFPGWMGKVFSGLRLPGGDTVHSGFI